MDGQTTYRVSDVARMFKRSRQRISEWVKNEDVAEFFSSTARRLDGETQSEFTLEDLYVFNSIARMVGQHVKWKTIASNLRTGWRDRDLPDTAMLIKPAPQTPSQVETIARLAVTTDQNKQQVTTITKLEARISVLQDTIHELEQEVKRLEIEKATFVAKLEARDVLDEHERQLIRVQRELEMMREGWRPPSSE